MLGNATLIDRQKFQLVSPTSAAASPSTPSPSRRSTFRRSWSQEHVLSTPQNYWEHHAFETECSWKDTGETMNVVNKASSCCAYKGIKSSRRMHVEKPQSLLPNHAVSGSLQGDPMYLLLLEHVFAHTRSASRLAVLEMLRA
ncbi:hypothetical protein KC340_g40 [Hortaea werneckii]|nr:hypothetical protein KC340_g40 [Hortaea werneckii]